MGSVCDVWAFGIMLFEALTGVHPWQIKDSDPAPGQIFSQVVCDPCPAPSEISPSVPEEFDQLCLRMVEKDPSRRPQGLEEFIETTARFLRHHGYAATSYAKPDVPRRGVPGGLPLQAEVNDLKAENARLRAELERLNRRVPVR
jgi:serine/threonine-protein kinase